MKRFTAFLLAGFMALGVSAVSFEDFGRDHWAFEAIKYAEKSGWINGVGVGRFNPDSGIKTAEFYAMLARLFYSEAVSEEEESTASKSAELDENRVKSTNLRNGEKNAQPDSVDGKIMSLWWWKYYSALDKAGVIADNSAAEKNGIKSEAEKAITRYDMASLCALIAKEKKHAAKVKSENKAKPQIGDSESIPAEYKEAVEFCYNAGILNGVDDKGSFCGNKGMTRAQACTVLARMNRFINGAEIPYLEKTPKPSYSGKKMPIFMYHNFTERRSETTAWTVTPERLREDLEWLKSNGYTTVLPRELVNGKLDGGGEIPEKLVMLTFDDGYESNYTLAFPILKEYGAKAVIAVIAERIGNRDGFLTWDRCREMNDSGLVEFGSHTFDTHSGGGVDGIVMRDGESREEYYKRIDTDIEKSIEIMESELGCEILYFAYPHGKTTAESNALIDYYFPFSVTTASRRANLSSLTRLPRYNVTEASPIEKYLK